MGQDAIAGRAADGDTAEAQIVFDRANLFAAQGKEDEAHELYLEAHRLDRRALLITLALGHSCFERKLWREAARYFASLGEHPEASEHAAEVAAGLVIAGRAEVNALRPADATKHYEAAVRIEPTCGVAWHALAEIALERNDLPRAAECLEHEATQTADPAARSRLFDALGELALDVIGDRELAQRCWLQAGDSKSSLDKLLLLYRERDDHAARGETCLRLAELDAARDKALLEEAIDAFATADDFVRARKAADRLIAAYPLDIDAVTSASAVALAACDADTAADWLGRALGARRSAGDRDPRHAELWRRLGDAERSRNRHAEAELAYKRAIELAPDSIAALAARRSVVDLKSARPTVRSLRALVEIEQSPDEIVSLARVLARSNQTDGARAMLEIAASLGVELTGADLEMFEAHPPPTMADDEAYTCTLGETDRRELVDDSADSPFDEIFDMLGEAAVHAAPDPATALCLAGTGNATRISTTSPAAVSGMYPQISKALGGTQTLLYASDVHEDGVCVLLSTPSVVVIGSKLAEIRSANGITPRDVELRFKLGRAVELARPRRIFAAGSDASAFGILVRGLWQAFGSAGDTSDDAVTREAQRLTTALPMLTRRRMTDLLATITHDALDPDRYLAACRRAADRSGLLAAGNALEAIQLAGGSQAAPHLVRLAASPSYLAARRNLRARHR